MDFLAQFILNPQSANTPQAQVARMVGNTDIGIVDAARIDAKKNFIQNLIGVLSPKEAYADEITKDDKQHISNMEQSGSMTGDYAQLEDIVLKDLKQIGKLDKSINLKQVKEDPNLYDNVVSLYWNRLDDFGIPDKEKPLWWLMPGRYKKAKGDIENIIGKTPEKTKELRNTMQNRVKNDKELSR